MKGSNTGLFFSEASTKEKIIGLFKGKGCLKANDIHEKLIESAKARHSYQATHKALKELAEASVLSRKQKSYALNPAWVKALKAFAEHLEN
ncbi:hypothetical protein HZB89_00715 [archaeon]|nr:hypothetical protein [archaeon]